MSVEVVTRPCAWCHREFIPSQAQLGQEQARPTCNLFCAHECYEAHRAERNRAFFRSDAGRAYQRNRNRKNRKTTTTEDES
jgi:hypothetical protein